MSTLSVSNIKHPSAASNNIVLDANGNASVAGTLAMGTPFGNRNKIINGDMRIHQRGTASVTFDTFGTYIVDRWTQNNSGGCTIVGQRSTTAPAGFTNSLDVTASVGGAPSAAQLRVVRQYIEGFNVADLQWGTAGALPITVSFYIRSNVTGTFAVSIANSAFNRSQVQHFTINAANTFEYKTVTFSGDMTGTWLNDNNVGINLTFDLGSGSNYNAPSTGSWSGAYYSRTSSSVNLSSTTSNHIYLTGVQLEAGSVATPFERRLYTTELQLAQRYFQWVPFSMGFQSNGANHFLQMQVPFQVQMRTVPSFAIISADPNSTQVTNNNLLNTFNAAYSSVNYGFASLTASVAANCQVLGYRSAASAEL